MVICFLVFIYFLLKLQTLLLFLWYSQSITSEHETGMLLGMNQPLALVLFQDFLCPEKEWYIDAQNQLNAYLVYFMEDVILMDNELHLNQR